MATGRLRNDVPSIMRLLQLKAENFRLFHRLSLQASSRLNLFLGPNAAGKTSLLEAIYTLARAKSFRGNAAAELAGSEHRQWVLFGRTETTTEQLGHQLGVRWRDGETEVRIDSQPGTSLDLLNALIVQVLEPGMHRMLQDGPTYRRSFIDWGVFHVEPSFFSMWRRYRRALRQRNQALRQNRPDREVAIWEPELAETGEALDALRLNHLQQIAPSVSRRLERLLDEGEWRFELQPGWQRGTPLIEVLARSRATDRRLGTTQSGPHRAELRIRAGEHGIKHRISRGQQKLLISAMVLAQSDEVARVCGRHPILLVDDFGAELADHYQKALLQELLSYPGQTFVTAFERGGALSQLDDAAMFHVERGTVRPANP